MYKKTVKLKNGTIVEGDFFEKEDQQALNNIYKGWLTVSNNSKKLGGRNLNIPDVLSEALFCINFGCIRTNNEAKSYDCVRIKDGAGIQVKATSIANDCTSFGPKSTWDELYFMDFAPNGEINGKIEVYKIDKKLDNIVLNAGKKETFKMQQKAGRRPRFSIKSLIIDKYKLKPVKTIIIK